MDITADLFKKKNEIKTITVKKEKKKTNGPLNELLFAFGVLQ